ncbi:MAG: hypothetical protein ABMB14_34790 [Myxococcota bacterium]
MTGVLLLAAGCDSGSDGATGGRAKPSGTPPASASGPSLELNDGPPCDDSGWCWESPVIGGAGGLVAFADDDLWWTTGAFLLHWDGEGVRWAATPTSNEWTTLWGSSGTDLWIGGGAGIAHWDGAGWDRVDDLLTTSIDGTGSDDVWAATTEALWHFDGSAWSAILDGAWYGVVATGLDRAVVAGVDQGYAVVWSVDDGAATDLEPPKVSGPPVVFASPDETWIASDGVLSRYDGSWDRISGDVRSSIHDGWVGDPGSAWFLSPTTVEQWEGDELTALDTPGIGQSLAVTPADHHVWVGLWDGTVRRTDGRSWSAPVVETLNAETLAVAVRADGVGWAAGVTSLLERSPDAQWTAGPPPGGWVYGVAVTGGEALLFALDGTWRLDGGRWSRTEGGDGLGSACATSDGTVFAAGFGVGVVRLVGAEWQPEGGQGGALDYVTCLGAEVWAGASGDFDLALRYDGAAWVTTPDGVAPIAAGVGSHGDQIGLDSMFSVIQRDGEGWRLVDDTRSDLARSAVVAPDGRLWAITGGDLLAWDGEWSAPERIGSGFAGVTLGEDGRVYAFGNNGVASTGP